MNREIKFRCWDGNNGLMWEVTDIQWAKKGGLIYIRGTFIKDGKKEPIGGFKNQMTTKRWNNLKLIQYTGLKDKNGKEIYEGNILDWGFWHKGDGERGVVDFMESWGSFALNFYSQHGGEGSDFLYKWIKDHKEHIAIIGTIFENKDLLKEENDEKRPTK